MLRFGRLRRLFQLVGGFVGGIGLGFERICERLIRCSFRIGSFRVASIRISGFRIRIY